MFVVKNHVETILHFCHGCLNQIQSWHSCNLENVFFRPQSAIFGFFDTDTVDDFVLNHPLLVYKICVCASSGKSGYLSTTNFQAHIGKMKNTEKKTW